MMEEETDPVGETDPARRMVVRPRSEIAVHRADGGARSPSALLLTAGVLVVLILGSLTYIGFTIWLKRWLHSESFHTMLTDRTATALHVDGTFMPLHWTGWSVYSDGFAGRGQPTAPLESLRADQLRADLELDGFYHRRWEIPELQLQRLRVTLRDVTPRPPASGAPSTPAHHPQPSPHPLEGGAPSTPGHHPQPSPHPLEGGAPSTPGHDRPAFHGDSPSLWGTDQFALNRISVAEAECHWQPSGHLAGVRLSARPDADGWLIDGSGGKLYHADLTPLVIDQFKLRYHPSKLYVTDAQFKLADSGQISVSGEIDLDAANRLALQVAANRLPVELVVPPDWRARLTGQVAGEARLTGADSLTARGTVRLQPGTLRALPILDSIAVFTGTEQFRELNLQQATAGFEWSNGTLSVTNLVLESTGLLRVEGAFTVVNQQLEGAFEVGVTAASLRWLPGSRTRVFTVDRGGYLWTTVRVAGPVDRLQEDLSARLVAAAAGEAVEGTTRTLQQGAREVLDLLKPLLP